MSSWGRKVAVWWRTWPPCGGRSGWSSMENSSLGSHIINLPLGPILWRIGVELGGTPPPCLRCPTKILNKLPANGSTPNCAPLAGPFRTRTPSTSTKVRAKPSANTPPTAARSTMCFSSIANLSASRRPKRNPRPKHHHRRRPDQGLRGSEAEMDPAHRPATALPLRS